MRLFSQLRKVFGRDLPLAILFRAPTVEKLAALMVNEGHSARWKSVVAINRAARSRRCFWFQHRGNVLEFASLANLLGLDRPFYATQSRGLDGSEPPLRRVEDMAQEYIKELRQVQPHGPYYLGGACMGGIVAFEMAQQLGRAGEQIAVLALLDAPFARAVSRTRGVPVSLLRPLAFVFEGVGRATRGNARPRMARLGVGLAKCFANPLPDAATARRVSR